MHADGKFAAAAGLAFSSGYAGPEQRWQIWQGILRLFIGSSDARGAEEIADTRFL